MEVDGFAHQSKYIVKQFILGIINCLLSKILPFILILSSILIICLEFLYIKTNAVDLNRLNYIGTFLTGTAAFLAILLGRLYWKQKRSEAACLILGSFKTYADNISEIIKNPDIFQYEGYYPFNIPEIANNKSITYPERPNRLVNNEFGNLKKAFTLNIFQISGSESIKLMMLEKDIIKLNSHINGFLQAYLGDHPDRKIILKNHNTEDYLEKLNEICKCVEKILSPIIKSGF